MLALFDFNNLAMRNFLGSPEVGAKEDNPQYGFWKYLMFNSIYYTLSKFKDINEVVLAYDDPKSWRKVVYPLYKANRKKDEEIDWDKFFYHFHDFLNDIKTMLPIKVMSVSRAEADDILGVLPLNLNKKCMIVSSDSDYKQLYDVAKIYDPLKRDFLKYEDPEKFIIKLSLMGQKKDNILNCKTPDNWPEGKRRPALGEKTAEKIINENIEEFLDKEVIHNFEFENEKYEFKVDPRKRFNINKRLLDFKEIPDIIKDRILKQYREYETPGPERIYSFFKKQNWPTYLEEYEKVENLLLKLY